MPKPCVANKTPNGSQNLELAKIVSLKVPIFVSLLFYSTKSDKRHLFLIKSL
jgi:hypothetical protein